MGECLHILVNVFTFWWIGKNSQSGDILHYTQSGKKNKIIHQIRLNLLNHSGDISKSADSCRVTRKNHQISENLLDHSGVFCNCVNSGWLKRSIHQISENLVPALKLFPPGNPQILRSYHQIVNHQNLQRETFHAPECSLNNWYYT